MPDASSALSAETLAYGRRMTTALLGVDVLYRDESGDSVGLAVVNMDAEGEFQADPFPSYEEAVTCFDALREEAGTLPEPDRRRYYDDLCRSTSAFIGWRQAGLPFRAQLTGFLHVPDRPATDRRLESLRSRISDQLGELGYDGELAKRCAAWEERNRVAREDVPRILQALIDRSWERTEELLLPIPADPSDGMRVKAVSGAAFNARCNYLDREVEINTDPTLTLPALKHLAVHECCPGHYLQFKLREAWFREGRAAADGLLSLVNSASSCVFEGIGDAGMSMVDWDHGGDDRVQALLNVYRAGIGTGAAWRLHALGWSEEHVRDWLRSQSLVGGEGWVAGRMQFISAPSRAVLIWSYWWGERVVAGVWNRVAIDRRPAFLEFLYGRMHSNASLEMFS